MHTIRKIVYALAIVFAFSGFVIQPSYAQKPVKVKIGFLVHDLVSERWKLDMENFSNKVESLGGQVVTKNAFGDAQVQVDQGKMLIDEGIKVIAVVAQDGKVLSRLVDYAEKKGAIIIAYDRMIPDCNLNYYISFNSIRVGELMAEYALKLKPKGNYIILNGPFSDNNAILVRQGIMNKLKKPIDSGDVNILMEKQMDAWYPLNALMSMDEFISTNKKPIDVIIAGSDDLASGAVDALKTANMSVPIVTGQDATIDACRNIILGNQSMTVFKSIKKLSTEAAILAMKIAKGEKIEGTTTLNNGKRDVVSILFDPVAVDKNNLRSVVIGEGQIKEADLN